MGRLALLILDGLGIGHAPDTDKFGDTGSDTLGNVARMVGGFDLPYLEKVGFGCCRSLEGMSCTEPLAAYGVAQPLSQGKDSTTGPPGLRLLTNWAPRTWNRGIGLSIRRPTVFFR